MVADYGEEKKPVEPEDPDIQRLKREIEAHSKNIESCDAQLEVTTQSQSQVLGVSTELVAVPEETNHEINKAAADEVLEIFGKYQTTESGDMSLDELKKLIKGTQPTSSKTD